MAPPVTSLKLLRDKANYQFESWRLTNNLVKGEETINLPNSVLDQPHGTDYISTRAAWQHNHITETQSGNLYVFLAGDQDGASEVHRIVEPRGPGSVSLSRVAGTDKTPMLQFFLMLEYKVSCS